MESPGFEEAHSSDQDLVEDVYAMRSRVPSSILSNLQRVTGNLLLHERNPV